MGIASIDTPATRAQCEKSAFGFFFSCGRLDDHEKKYGTDGWAGYVD